MRDGKSEMLWAKRLYVTGGSSLGVDRSAAGASGAFSGGFSGAFGAPAATAALMSSDRDETNGRTVGIDEQRELESLEDLHAEKLPQRPWRASLPTCVPVCLTGLGWRCAFFACSAP